MNHEPERSEASFYKIIIYKCIFYFRKRPDGIYLFVHDIRFKGEKVS